MTNTNQKQVDWLVLLYVAADDVPPENILEATLVDECNKMMIRLRDTPIDEKVAVVALTDDNLRVDQRGKYKYIKPAIWIHEEKAWREARWEQLDEEAQLMVDIVDRTSEFNTEVDSGTPRTLSYFMRWALRQYPQAKKIMLSIIGHGGGWSASLPGDSVAASSDAGGPGHPGGGAGFQATKGGGHSPSLNGLCPDLTSGTALSTLDLREALAFGLNGKKLDVLFLDSCLMGMIEVAYEIRDHVRYLVAGQTLLWSQLPYEIYFDAKNFKPGIQPRELAQQIVQLYNSDSERVQKSWSIAAINLEYVDRLRQQIDQLASQLVKWIEQDRIKAIEAIARAYYKSQQFDYNADSLVELTESYVDIFDFSLKLDAEFKGDGRAPAARTNSTANSIVGATNAIFKATAVNGKGRRFRKIINEPDGEGRRFRIVKDSESMLNDHPETLLGSVGFDPSKAVISAFVQTDITPPNQHEKRRIDVDDAYGLSIYFPMGEVVDPIDDTDIDDGGVEESLERRLKRYTSQLSFAKASPNWVALLNELPRILQTKGDPAREALLEDLKGMLLSIDEAEPTGDVVSADEAAPSDKADEAAPLDKAAPAFSQWRAARRRVFCTPRQRLY